MVARHRVSIPVPAQRVPFVRDWFTPALENWTRSVYGGRRGWFIVFGWLFWFWLALAMFKFTVYIGVVAVMLALFILTAMWDMATYRWRRKRALR